GVTTRGQVITVTDGPRRDQQVDIDSTLYMPAGVDAQHRAPAVIGSHGWGANKDALRDDALGLARAGYVVLLYSARGFGNSNGQVAFDSPDYEVLDVKQLISWLAGQPGVLLDGPGDPRVGLAGGSYGGGISLLTAAYDPRVDAIVPSITWNSLVTALLPNAAAPGAPGVYKQQWAGIFSIGVGGGCARLVPAVCQALQNLGTTGTADPQTLALLNRSSPASVISQIRAPTLLVQGEADTLFPVSEAVANYRAILATGTPVRMVWLAGGHDTGLTGADQARQTDMTRAWFDHWLKRDAAVALPPAFTYARPDVGGVGTADRYPPPGDEATYTLSGAGQLVAPGQPVTANPQPMLNPPGGRPASVSSLPGVPGLVQVGQFIGNFVFDVPGEFVAFQSDPLPGDVNVVGTPTVAVRIAAASSAGNPVTLFAKLYDAAPDGKLTLPQQQIAPLRLAGAAGAGGVVRIPLAGISHLFPAGHSLRLVFATTDMAYFADRQPATLLVSPVPGATLGLPTQPVPDTSQLPVVPIVVAAVVVGVGAVLLVLQVARRRRALAREMAVEPPDAVPVDIDGLSKRFEGGVLAVDDVSFRVAPGQIVGLLGPNGAGKTTTLRMLLGLVHPSGGQVRLFGHRVRPGHPVLRRVGAFVEGPGIPPYLTGLEALREYWRYGNDPDSDAHFDDALRIAGLGDAVHRRVRTYSHGMRQRLALAQAMLGRPGLLVLDEPTNGLDPPQIREMREVIRGVAAAGTTVLLSSHLLAEVEEVCTHVVVMDRGRLVAQGRVADLVAGTRTVHLQVDDPASALPVLDGLRGVRGVRQGDGDLVVELDSLDRPGLVRALVAAGVGVQGVSVRRRLEEVFLGLVAAPGGPSPDGHPTDPTGRRP
ncbi:MAG: alpha/beta fold hydrolase, partial [Frankiaceae bacterium]